MIESKYRNLIIALSVGMIIALTFNWITIRIPGWDSESLPIWVFSNIIMQTRGASNIITIPSILIQFNIIWLLVNSIVLSILIKETAKQEWKIKLYESGMACAVLSFALFIFFTIAFIQIVISEFSSDISYRITIFALVFPALTIANFITCRKAKRRINNPELLSNDATQTTDIIFCECGFSHRGSYCPSCGTKRK